MAARASVRAPDGASAAQGRVLVVGAGPVGLMAAVQIKLKRPGADVLVVEKHAAYRRSHVLELRRSTFAGVAGTQSALRETISRALTSAGRAVLGSLGQNLRLDLLGRVAWLRTRAPPAAGAQRLQQVVEGWLRHRFVRTNAVERDLAALARALGVRFRTGETVDARALDALLRETRPHVLVGADGAHSAVRRHLFGDRMRYDETLNYLVDFKYEVRGRTRPLALLSEAYRTLKCGCNRHLVIEHVGRPAAAHDEGAQPETQSCTPVTLHVLVNREIYECVSGGAALPDDAQFSLRTHRERLPAPLADTLEHWLRVRRRQLGDVPAGAQRISALPLRTFAAERFVRTRVYEDAQGRRRRVRVALAGDAAIGCVFFRGLNVGLRCATELAGAVAAELRDEEAEAKTEAEAAWSGYAEFMAAKAQVEREMARLKNCALEQSFASSQRIGRLEQLTPLALWLLHWRPSPARAVASDRV